MDDLAMAKTRRLPSRGTRTPVDVTQQETNYMPSAAAAGAADDVSQQETTYLPAKAVGIPKVPHLPEDVTFWDTSRLPSLSRAQLHELEARHKEGLQLKSVASRRLLMPLPDVKGREADELMTTQMLAVQGVGAGAVAGAGAATTADTAAAPSTTGKVAWNSLVQLAGNVVNYGSGVVALALTTKILTVSNYGSFVIANTVLAFIQILAVVGITPIGIRETARFPQSSRDIFSAAMSLQIITSAVAYGSGILIVQFLPYSHDVKIATIVIGASMFFVSVGRGFDVVFLPRLRTEPSTVADAYAGVYSMAALAGLLWVIRNSPSAPAQLTIFYTVLLITAVGNGLAFVIRWIGAAGLTTLRLRVNFVHWRYLLSMSIPVAAVAILGTIQYRADAVMLSLMRPARDVAIYGLAVQIMGVMLTVPVIFVGTVFPVLSRYAEERQPQYYKTLQRVFDACIALAVPAASALIFLAPEIVEIIGSGKYPKSTQVLQILAVSLVFNFLATLYSNLVIIHNRSKSLIWTLGVLIVFNIALNALAIPIYSYTGSAVITDMTECVRMLFTIAVFAIEVRWWPSIKIFGQAGLATAAMVITIVLHARVRSGQEKRCGHMPPSCCRPASLASV
jgi:O-antigen/teichoic acid export membrane protein